MLRKKSNQLQYQERLVEKHVTHGGLCYVKFPHHWGKLSTLFHAFYNPSGWHGAHPWGMPMTSVHNSDWIEFDLTKNQTEGETTDLMQKEFASWKFLMCCHMQSV